MRRIQALSKEYVVRFEDLFCLSLTLGQEFLLSLIEPVLDALPEQLVLVAEGLLLVSFHLRDFFIQLAEVFLRLVFLLEVKVVACLLHASNGLCELRLVLSGRLLD